MLCVELSIFRIKWLSFLLDYFLWNMVFGCNEKLPANTIAYASHRTESNNIDTPESLSVCKLNLSNLFIHSSTTVYSLFCQEWLSREFGRRTCTVSSVRFWCKADEGANCMEHGACCEQKLLNRYSDMIKLQEKSHDLRR